VKKGTPRNRLRPRSGNNSLDKEKGMGTKTVIEQEQTRVGRDASIVRRTPERGKFEKKIWRKTPRKVATQSKHGKEDSETEEADNRGR